MWWLYWLVIAMHILSILYNVLRGLKHEREFRRDGTDPRERQEALRQVKTVNAALQKQGATPVAGEGSGRWN